MHASCMGVFYFLWKARDVDCKVINYYTPAQFLLYPIVHRSVLFGKKVKDGWDELDDKPGEPTSEESSCFCWCWFNWFCSGNWIINWNWAWLGCWIRILQCTKSRNKGGAHKVGTSWPSYKRKRLARMCKKSEHHLFKHVHIPERSFQEQVGMLL